MGRPGWYAVTPESRFADPAAEDMPPIPRQA